jgi:AbiV family abortive infection protein
MRLNLRTLQHFAGQSLRNAMRLHFDSILLYKYKSFPSAFFISVIAMEELGKAYWADHFVFYSKDVRYDNELETAWVNKLHSDHRAKQLWFLRQMAKVDERFYQFVNSRQLDILKQDSIYVGLQKVGHGVPRTKGKLINPKNLKSGKVKTQLNMLHDFLVEEATGIKDDRIDFGLGAFNKILDKRLLGKLRSKRIK